jgi:D-lactate dehydratase
MSQHPKKVLLAVTGYYGPFYPDGKNTGAYFSEIYHPYKVFTKNGFEVVIVSENGKVGLDDGSVVPPAVSEEETKLLETKSDPFFSVLNKVVKASSVSAKDFSIFFAAGGHGTVFDFVSAPHLQGLAAEIYEQGGVVAAVCHGPVILGNIVLSNGEKLLKGKKVTGFTDEGEVLIGLDKVLNEKGFAWVAATLKQAGGLYQDPSDPWASYTVSDQRVVTGVNPASATDTAEKTLVALKA